MDPITILMTALVTGAAAGLQPTAQQAVKDAYNGLKSLIKRKYERVSVDILETDPSDNARKQVLRADLTNANAAADEEVLRQAKTVIEAVRDHAADVAAAVGIRFDELESASLRIDDIIASGTGVDIRKAKVTGDVTITRVRAGNPSGPDHP